MHRVIRATVVATATAALVVPAASALAASAKVVDSKNDTWNQTFDETNGTTSYSKSDKTVNADVAKAVIKHTNSNIQLVVDFASMKKSGTAIYVNATLKTDAGGAPFDLSVSGYDDGNKWNFDGVAYQENSPTGPSDGCQSLDTAVDWQADTVTVTAPRSCFNNPAWVEAHVQSMSGYQKPDGTFVSIIDNAHNETHNEKGWTGKIKKG